MKRLIGIVLICAMTMGIVTACAPVIEVPETETAKTTAEGPVRPQDDYYRYINGERLANAEFEYGAETAESSFDISIVDDQVESVIKDTVAGTGYEIGSEEYVIQTAYNAFMEYDFNNEPIPEDLVKIFDDIDNAKTVDELLAIDAMLIRDYGLTGFFNAQVADNYFSSGERIITFSQRTALLDASFSDMRDDNFATDGLAESGKQIMQAKGYDLDTSKEYGKQLALLAVELYGSTDLDVMDAGWSYEYMTIVTAAELENDIFTNVDMSAYLAEIGLDSKYCDEFCIADRGQLECLNGILVDDNIEALKLWETGELFTQYMRFLAPHFTEFSGYVQESYDSMEDQAIDEIKKAFYEETDPIYVERFYTQEMDDALVSMCDDIREGYRVLIGNATWLTEGTRQGLLEKLDNIVYITGMDLKRHDASKYADLGGNYYEILLQYKRIHQADVIASLGEPVDRKDNGMPMQMVNACYDPGANTICITVAITNKPFFDVDADYYTNLGGLGSVIAHEMGHAFDSNCIVYDKDGVYNPSWIAPEDMEALEARNEEAVRYFEDNFVVFGVYHVDGEQTLGENYADLGGMECVTSLAKTDEDLIKIFESYATIWCSKTIDTQVVDLIAYDEHSPELIRTNAILSALDCFYEVYDVKEGDGMYIAPENRVSRWY